MDERLVAALRRVDPPFDGMTLESVRSLSAEDLMRLCENTLAWIRRRSEIGLRVLQDWSFHDGHVTESARTSLDELDRLFGSAGAMIAALSYDDLVCTGVYPEDMSFFWRWGSSTDLVEPFQGRFDLTAATALLDQLPIPSDLSDSLARKNDFFGRCYHF